MTTSPDLAVSVGAGTYPEMALSATRLYDRLRYEAAHAGEPVDFAAAGDVGLDVGSYDGAYRSVIGALGLRRVVSIEPMADILYDGIKAGMVPDGDAFGGTLQAWVEQAREPAGAVFIFNMMPSLPNDPTFVRAVAEATAPGGIVAATFREPITCTQFATAAPRVGLRMLYGPVAARFDAPPLELTARNKFLHLYRRGAA
ncbi:MAG TPA: hypothetical protein VF466_02700 [Candidatus Saccharimonadales bacterium]